MLDHVLAQKGPHTITSGELSRLEWKWLALKAFKGTS